MKRYDIVIIGAGNAGISAACKAAQAGKKTLLIERHNIPGGCANSFVRGRFEFENSLHEFCDWGSDQDPGKPRKLIEDEYGAKIKWYFVPDTFRVIGTARSGRKIDATMPAGRQAFIDKMEYYVPGSKKAMTDFFELAQEVTDALEYLDSDEGSKYIKEHFPNFVSIAACPANKVFKIIDMPDDAIDILNTYWSYIGIDCDSLSFVHYASMVNKYITRAAYIPEMTSHGLTTAMIERIRTAGADIWMHTAAIKILFKDGKVCGVQTTAGSVETEHVICNVNPHTAYANMIPAEVIPKREIQLANARKHSTRALIIYLGLNKTAEELKIHDYGIFLPGTMDTVKAYNNMKRLDTNNYSIFLCYNIVNPNASPEGTAEVSFFTAYEDEVWADISQRDYFKKKTEIARNVITHFEDMTGIDLSDSIEEIEVATPWTFARYANTPQGAVYGYETNAWDNIMVRSIMLKADYQIPGLYFAGGFGLYGDGYGTTYQCGELMAKLALSDMQTKGGK